MSKCEPAVAEMMDVCYTTAVPFSVTAPNLMMGFTNEISVCKKKKKNPFYPLTNNIITKYDSPIWCSNPLLS